MCHPPTCSRARHGRLLVEALVALVVSAAVLSALAGVTNSALAMSDAAVQFDLAARSAEQSAAEALRAPCRLVAGHERVHWSARHIVDRQRAAGAVATVRLIEFWHAVGVGRHDSVALVAQIGVRCE
ncbi:MAG: hypothetical protein K2R93_15545 [Gemmatimonadaceae bacterium]|nr:hypothetical protein [Gemmatimonadaceae bacterium]